MNNTLTQYEHKTLQDINSNYTEFTKFTIKDLFRFFSYEYTQMLLLLYLCLYALEKQIEWRLHTTGLIHNWIITIDGPTLSEVRDTTIHNILNGDDKRHPIKIIFMFSQSKGMEIEMCQFIIE